MRKPLIIYYHIFTGDVPQMETSNHKATSEIMFSKCGYEIIIRVKSLLLTIPMIFISMFDI